MWLWVHNNADLLLILVQIAFYITVGTVTVWTYFRAKATILQPIKTETYKEQLRVITALSELVCGKTESELRDTFGMNELVQANVQQLLDDFFSEFAEDFAVKLDVAQRLYASSRVPNMDINLKSAIASDWVRLGPPSTVPLQESHTPNPIHRTWQEYEWEYFHRTKTYFETSQRLSALRRSPFLPDEIAETVRTLEESLRLSEMKAKEIISLCGRELFRRKEAGALRVSYKETEGWVASEIMRAIADLSPAANAICVGAKAYIKSNEIMV